jgi:hypothetical protein
MILSLVFALLLIQSQQQPNRPTEPTDPMPPPNMDYFVGTWSFDWNVPESPLGSGGKMRGRETYKKILDSPVYESDIQGEGPDGPFKGRAITSYDEKEKLVSRYEIFSYGLSTLKTGTIGGDLGGYYTIYWESTPVKKNGHVVKFKGKTQMLSPAHYKLQIEISVDGGQFTSYGSPWFRKVDAKAQS